MNQSLIECDILIVGGSTGGTAAALAAASNGAKVCLLEETNWLGGQLTSQGVSTPDENNFIEQFGGTHRYNAFRQAIRTYYSSNYQLTEKAAKQQYFNPGNCWVSRLSFEPKVGAHILKQMLEPSEASGMLQLFFGASVLECIMDKHHTITKIISRLADSTEAVFSARYILDATDLGEVLALAGVEGKDWLTGAESQAETGEPDAPIKARPDWVQPFTFPFALDWSPETSDSNIIAKPQDYEKLKASQKYHIKHGAITGLFTGELPWWTYRRLLAAENFADPRISQDLSMINTDSNDFYGGNIIGANAGDKKKIKHTIEQARRASLGYVYWLQTECPREDVSSPQRQGYPEFRLRTDVFDIADGCSIKPYIRESRRIKSLRPILEQEIVVADRQGNICLGENARAVFMSDTVGIGHYPLDIHPNGHGEPSAYMPTRPFQIPLGALLPVRFANLLPACKNIGTTHLSNGAYRLHPIEWNIGESTGLLAAFCLKNNCNPSNVFENHSLLKQLQQQLLRNGIALNWYIDVPLDHAAFEAVQMLACAGIQLGSDNDLLFLPDEMITPNIFQSWRNTIPNTAPANFIGTRAEAAITIYQNIDIKK